MVLVTHCQQPMSAGAGQSTVKKHALAAVDGRWRLSNHCQALDNDNGRALGAVDGCLALTTNVPYN